MKHNASMTVLQMQAALQTKQVSSVELTQDALHRIAQKEPTVGAFLTLDAQGALQAARQSDERRAAGRPLHALDGIPYAVKDNFCTRKLRTTCASRMLENYLPPYDAAMVEYLQQAGCVLLGKLNMDEFAMGSSTRRSALAVTRNPLDPKRVPGGSSGGAAVAVAAGEVPFTVGSDTGGSVRQPASFCGVVGCKPTYGLLSRYGMVSFAPSMDSVGLVTQTASDAALLLELLSRKDPRDATACAHPDPYFLKSLTDGVRGLRIAVVPDAGVGRCLPAVAASVAQAVARLRQAGATVETATLPSPEAALLSYCAISAVEAASSMARYDGIRFGASKAKGATASEYRADFGEEVKRRILLGTALLSGEMRERYYLPALTLREELTQTLLQMFSRYDIILKPTTPCGAFRFDETLTDLQMREMDICTVYANLAGIPAISVPLGSDENQMPLGIQLMSAPLREDLILRGAAVLEQESFFGGE